MDGSLEVVSLVGFATRIRVSALRMVHDAEMGHPGADMSSADIIAALYGAVLDPEAIVRNAPDRDRVIVSKSHCCGALYSALAMIGCFPESDLATFGAPNSYLCTAVSARAPGVEASTGALGHGMPIAVGCALGARISGSPSRTFVLTGDGELQEGSNWEAAMLAATHRLGSLTLIVDRNHMQKDASTEDVSALEPLADKWRAFGWDVVEVDGHDPDGLAEVLSVPPGDRPRCIIAETVKGKGVSFMENNLSWHNRRMTDDEVVCALAELDPEGVL